MYNQSTHVHQHLIHHHVQYSHENPSLSPQQSSTSDADETSNPSPAIINRGIVGFNSHICMLFRYSIRMTSF